MMYQLFLIVTLFAVVSGKCDNSCSGHGVCGSDDKCICYKNWGVGQEHQSGDCSQRMCPQEIAWTDAPDQYGKRHNYAECSNRGICDRETGECACFDGYEGKACARTTCPNDCSGHGTCEFIDDFYYKQTYHDYDRKSFSYLPKTFDYYGWDSRKTRGCICDAGYIGNDCSMRMCEYGTDPLDVRENLDVIQKHQVQRVQFSATGSNCDEKDKTFAMRFKSATNETYDTHPIVFKCDSADMEDFTNDMTKALLQLPAQVINNVHVACFMDITPVDNDADIVGCNITLTGCNVQGRQNYIEFLTDKCEEGCTPRRTGIDMIDYDGPGAGNNEVSQNKYNSINQTQASDYNSYECSRRGKCNYETGECACFDGYSGRSCNMQVANNLV